MNSDQIISDVIHEAGHVGLGYIGVGVLITLVLIGVGVFVWVKYIKKDNKLANNDSNDNSLFIVEFLKELKTDLQKNTKTLNSNISLLKKHVDNLEHEMNVKFEEMDNKMHSIPVKAINKIIEDRNRIEQENKLKHKKAFDDALRLGDEIYDILMKYTREINCHHIFVGSFHNGSESLEGIPYIKMDIIREVYHPTDVYELDHAFAPVYKDCELSLLGKLPRMLIQNKLLYFNVDEKGNSEMFKYDSLVIRRMIGMDIKQIALHVTQENGIASGFVGCVRYDNDDMDLDQLELCVKELEIIHNNARGF